MRTKKENKGILFWGISTIILLSASLTVSYLAQSASKIILPELIQTRHFSDDKRTAETFAENFSPQASKGELNYLGDSSFTFTYTKSGLQTHPFSGVFFPLENLDIDFSKYDAIRIGIKPQKARRIPFNLSVQNKKDTHQYVRQFIEINKEQEIYTLQLSDFFTPTSWYDHNNVAQLEIPDPDFSKIEALSFESCHLLKNDEEDQFEVYHLELIKNNQLVYLVIGLFVVLSIFFLRVWLFDLFQKKKEIIHIPIKQVELEKSDAVEDHILIYLSENYTNPNLILNDLTKEFGINSREMSVIIKGKTEMTFPKYINFIRVEEAKRLIKSRNFKTISEVGYMVGFNSPSNFNRVFKAIVGTSPKQYK
ncbi:MAG: AraC-like DNA-binding protein [Glaciecola sp.]|jgi:AraC-like DNA-binding protein